MIEWVLIVTVGALGPYPVALKSYPERWQCVRAAAVSSNEGDITARCIPVSVPESIKGAGR